MDIVPFARPLAILALTGMRAASIEPGRTLMLERG